jgi:23S rRNA pseudouridine2604 synthase
MTFRRRLQYFLVKKLRVSNKKAIEYIISSDVSVNNIICNENIEIKTTDEIAFKNEVLQVGKKLVYIAFYKPTGVETTLNTALKDNLRQILPFEEDVFPVGRLDKASEGLLLLTNDGQIFDKTLRKEYAIEKEYEVEVDNEISEEFLQKMAEGVIIMGEITLPAKLRKLASRKFNIILKQGLNRQIRRMCFKLGYEVVSLKRIRIGEISIDNLKPLEYKYLQN